MRRRASFLLLAALAPACSDEAERHGSPPGDAGFESGAGEEAGTEAGTPDAPPPEDVRAPPDALAVDASDGSVEGGGLDAAEAGDAAPIEELADTGLYVPGTETLAPGVRGFRPRYELWSDGARKRRFLYLPPGEKIDTTDMDAWRFPIGTKAWKEFTRDGVRVETRIFEKVSNDAGADSWHFVAYAWNAEQTHAYAVPNGEPDAGGTPHDIPNQADCAGCHSGSPDFLLGVSAIQLAHDTAGLDAGATEALGLTLADLVDEQALTVAPPSTTLPLPGDAVAQEALGRMHANCGHCHRPESFIFERNGLDLHLVVGELATVEGTPAYRTTWDVPVGRFIEGADVRLKRGEPEHSAIYLRMHARGSVVAMPPIASELIDDDGSKAVYDWIDALCPCGVDPAPTPTERNAP